MRVVVQRVKHSKCSVDNKITGQIEQGFMLLVGFCQNDDETIACKMANKIAKLRIFDDDQGKMNRSIYDVEGSILSISQFTLYADCHKGNRPSFTDALNFVESEKLYDYFNQCLESLNLKVEKGIFGADMKIDLLNDGPITIILDSEEL